ncbi:hypothetical protein M422DRAFT_59010 [Sphaerobolus stellatus SS14]|nr:hypothetical protein M422DRAFT_59010 [Sphaerobolus stellatus SS14]
MAESISLEETNKIRISLGLKPLTDDGAPGEKTEVTAEDNYAKRREQETQERDRKYVASCLCSRGSFSRIRNKHELNATLKGTTLGEDAEVDDTISWIKRSKKKAKEMAKKQFEELEARDKAIIEEYTEKDLAGLKVSHDFEALREGEDRILTLKDSRILDNEEDELQNVELAEDAKTKKNNELKLKKPEYTGYDDDEFIPGNEGMKRSVLAKYDEELNGIPEGGFRLGGGQPKSSRPTRQTKEEDAIRVNKSLLSIDYAKNLDVSDYVQESDVGFKKPKNKKKRPNRKVEVDPEDIPPPEVNMDVDEKPSVRRRNLEEDFFDDDDLQAVLAKQRRTKVKKVKPLDPEEIARRILEEQEQARAQSVNDMEVDTKQENEGDDGAGDGGLEFDDTSEFVRSIQYNPIAVKEEERQTSVPARAKSEQRGASVLQGLAPRTHTPMETDQALHELEAGEVSVKEEPEDDETMLDAIEEAINAVEAEEKLSGVKTEELEGTSSEKTFSGGMAATLSILRQQGILAKPTADQLERERVQRERDKWLAEQRLRLTHRDSDRTKARGTGKDQATREYENRMREQQEAREQLETFKDYKPDINIVYHDEFGRELTAKEAWKALSHKFHGKGSGKMKTEKRLKKIAEEKKKEAMSSGDTPLSMNRAFQARQEKVGQAHMVLSVGNRGRHRTEDDKITLKAGGPVEGLDIRHISELKMTYSFGSVTYSKSSVSSSLKGAISTPGTLCITSFLNLSASFSPIPQHTKLPLANMKISPSLPS